MPAASSPCGVRPLILLTRALRVAIGGLLVAACAVQPNEVQPGDANLRDSFVAQITSVDGVRAVAREGDELTFSGPDGRGRTASWRVRIDSAVVEPAPGEGASPQGHIVSTWWRDGDEVEYLGTMTALCVGQECWAIWDTASRAWGC